MTTLPASAKVPARDGRRWLEQPCRHWAHDPDVDERFAFRAAPLAFGWR